MKIAIGYYTAHGNNKIVSETVASLLQEKGAEVDIYSVAEKKPEELGEADIYIFSSPTRMGGPAGRMKAFIKKFTPKEGAGYAILNTCLGAEGTKVVPKLSEILESKGLKRVAEGVCLQVAGAKGPLKDGETDKLKSFSDQVRYFSTVYFGYI